MFTIIYVLEMHHFFKINLFYKQQGEYLSIYNT